MGHSAAWTATAGGTGVTAPGTPAKGDSMYDETAKELKIYDGAAGVVVITLNA